jgi:ATP-binding cassette subfamily F protein 3
MLAVSNLSKSYGLKTVLQKISFTLKPGEVAGLVGPNGCGKTTLLRILAGVELPDSGSVHWTPAGLRMGYLPQGLEFSTAETVDEYLSRTSGNLPTLLAQLETAAEKISANPDDSGARVVYDGLLGELARVSNNALPAEEVLRQFGLASQPGDTPVAHLSGGQKTRLALAALLMTSPAVYLLDEPTNHLDIPMLEWLEDWLTRIRAAALVISHDRVFLDRICDIILELDPVTHQIKEYSGNYSDYLQAREVERQNAWQRYAEQQEEIADLRGAASHLRDIARFHKGGKADGGDKFAKAFFANRARATVGRAVHMEKRLQKLQNEDHIDKPRSGWSVKLDFDNTPGSGQRVLQLDAVSVGYETLTLLENVNLYLKKGERAVIIGENGCGKTTLMRTIIGQLPPLAGAVTLGAGTVPGYLPQEQDTLPDGENPLEVVRHATGWNDTQARNYLHRYLFAGDDVFTPVASLSYGERARLILAALAAQGCNLLLLDEPVNHMDIPSRERFEASLLEFTGTVLAITHDRYFIQQIATSIWAVEDWTIHRA